MKAKRMTLYPKTKRVKAADRNVVVTEKLDGSNLGFGKTSEGLFIASRNRVFMLKDVDNKEVRQLMYKGLYAWLLKHGETLEENMVEGALIFGEWMGMGQLNYVDFDRFYMFAKANIDDEIETVTNLLYNRELFHYSFISQVIPEFIKTVPVVEILVEMPHISGLDKLYDRYCDIVKRDVEGFILIQNENITKYVRNKRGVISPHVESYATK